MGAKITKIDSLFIVNGKAGDVYYSAKSDKHFTSLATYYGRKILTERLIAVKKTGDKPCAEFITKVTLL
jgi:hypothetical protein